MLDAMATDIAGAAAQLRRGALRDFGAPVDDESDGGSGRTSIKMAAPMVETPVPGLLRYALELIGLKAHGPAEKVAWWVSFTYRGLPCTVAHEKFGVRLYLSTSESEEMADAELRGLLKKLTSAARVAEKVLAGQAPALLDRGAATVANQYHSLHSAYVYFRERALNPVHVEDKRTEHEVEGLGRSWSFRSGVTVMAFNSRHDMVAGITAYLSLLEHVFVLALPFRGFDPDNDSLTTIVGARWGVKYSRIFDSHEKVATRIHERLTAVVETWRNPYAHGGFEKQGQGATIHLHTSVGAVPVGMTSAFAGRGFSFLPMADSTVEDVFALFDEMDAWLEREMPHAMRWVKSGLDVRFDEAFRDQLAAARTDDEEFERFLDYYSELTDRYANMDF